VREKKRETETADRAKGMSEDRVCVYVCGRESAYTRQSESDREREKSERARERNRGRKREGEGERK